MLGLFEFFIYLFEHEFKKKLLVYAGLFIVTLSLALFCREQYFNELNNMADSGYVVYLDGQEVNADKISFSQYSISINDEDKTIKLAEKKYRSRPFFYIPILH